MSGWSRYDHFAALCELFPTGIPALAMSIETILKAEPLRGDYPITNKLFQCTLPFEIGYTYGCYFPGSKVIFFINLLKYFFLLFFKNFFKFIFGN